MIYFCLISMAVTFKYRQDIVASCRSEPVPFKVDGRQQHFNIGLIPGLLDPYIIKM